MIVNQIYDHDAADFLASNCRRLGQGRVDAVFLDPPARFGIQTQGEDTPFDEQMVTMLPLAESIRDALRPGGAVVIMSEPQTLSTWDMAATWADFRFMAEIVVLWDQEPSREAPDIPSLSTAVRWYVRPGRRYGTPLEVRVDSNIVICKPVPLMERSNPAQKPVELYNYLITLLTNSGDIVADPFCGSGSALVAAAMCGRPYLGTDIDSQQAFVARRRVQRLELEEAYLRPLYLWTGRGRVPVEG